MNFLEHFHWLLVWRCETSLRRVRTFRSYQWFRLRENLVRSRSKSAKTATLSNCQHLSAAFFLKIDSALCCITIELMPKCWSQFEGMRDFWTSTRTKVFRFNQKFRNVLKCCSKFQCRPVGKIRWQVTGHAPIQLHTSHPHGKGPSQMAAAASYR